MMLNPQHITKGPLVTYRHLCAKALSLLTQRYDDEALTCFRRDLASLGIWTLPRVYLSTVTANTFLLVIALGILYRQLFFPIFSFSTDEQVFTFLAALTASALTFNLAPRYIRYKVAEREKAIEAELELALKSLSLIPDEKLTPQEIVKHWSASRFKAVKTETDRIPLWVELTGVDILSAISLVGRHCASDDLRRILTGMISTVHTGKSLREYLEMQTFRVE